MCLLLFSPPCTLGFNDLTGLYYNMDLCERDWRWSGKFMSLWLRIRPELRREKRFSYKDLILSVAIIQSVKDSKGKGQESWSHACSPTLSLLWKRLLFLSLLLLGTTPSLHAGAFYIPPFPVVFCSGCSTMKFHPQTQSFLDFLFETWYFLILSSFF